jgi:hypothetical protein
VTGCSPDVVPSLILSKLFHHQVVSTACFVETHNIRHLPSMRDIVSRFQ